MRLVIFDIDGTLTNTKKVDDKCFEKAFKQTFEIEIKELDWEVATNVTDWGLTEEVFEMVYKRKPSKSEYNKMRTNFMHLLKKEKQKDASQFTEVRGAVSFYNYVKNNTDWKVGIATGAWEQSALLKLQSIGIEIDGVAFSNSDYFISREGITQHTIDQIQEKHDDEITEVVYFGDGVWDYNTCKNLGIRFIGIDILNDDKLKKIGAKTVFQDYRDQEAILKEIRM